MRMAKVASALLILGCSREIRSGNPDLWLELQTEHFTLRTDLPADDARKAVADLELIRNALLAARWQAKFVSQERIAVTLLASNAELHEFVKNRLDGYASRGVFGERLIVASAEGGLLDSEVVKHELSHVLAQGYLVTDPRWVQEGIACYLETLEIDRQSMVAIAGATGAHRRMYLRDRAERIHAYDWADRVMGVGSAQPVSDGFDFETLSWGLVHWLIDTRPREFDAFLASLSQGRTMWSAFDAAFPEVDEAMMEQEVPSHLLSIGFLPKKVFNIEPWTGATDVRKLRPAEVYEVRTELVGTAGDEGIGDWKMKFAFELERARQADPGNPFVVRLTQDADPQLAIDAHPDDYRSWLVWFPVHPSDGASLRKAVELAPSSGQALALLAGFEQQTGRPREALGHIEDAARVFPDYRVFNVMAAILQAQDRCPEAAAAEERALASLSDGEQPKLQLELRRRLEDIVSRCEQLNVPVSELEATPLLGCRQQVERTAGIADETFARFTVGEDGRTSSVAIRGLNDVHRVGSVRAFVESCRFKPPVLDGKPHAVQLDLAVVRLKPSTAPGG
jgi:tetratricopeptide (TPR) repeat protein